MENKSKQIQKEGIYESVSIEIPISVELQHANLPEAIQRQRLATLVDKNVESNEFYKELTDFIESDVNNARIILYLPIKMLPNIKDGLCSEEQMGLAKSIKNGWFRLLHESEVRAVYLDGDELETGLGTPTRVRKAAHLLPFFLEKGILTENEVLQVFEVENEIELDKSLLDGIEIAIDMGLLSEAAQNKVTELAKEKIIYRQAPTLTEETFDDKTLIAIKQELEKSLSDIKKRYQNPEITKRISKKRATWAEKVDADEAIEIAASKTSYLILKDEKNIRQLDGLGIFEIRSFYKAMAILAEQNPKKAKEFLINNKSIFSKYMTSGTTAEKEEVINAVNRLSRFEGIIANIDHELGIKTIDLGSEMPIDMRGFIKNDGRQLVDAIQKIETSDKLSKYIYPFFLIFGSRVKGYAAADGDFDMSIFVRPNVNWEQREEILKTIKEELPELTNIDRVLEYWVKEDNEKLGLKLPTSDLPDTVVGVKQIHFLFGGVWIGNDTNLKRLKSNLTEKYLNLEKFGNQKDNVRTMLLRQIELDVLQYRLMHKGYKKMYPVQKRVSYTHGDSIDWKSDYWDEGYRKLATKLFLTKVFLPDLSS